MSAGSGDGAGSDTHGAFTDDAALQDTFTAEELAAANRRGQRDAGSVIDLWSRSGNACLAEALIAARLLRTDPRPRRWIIQDWLPVGAVTLFAGDGGTGKSLLAQQLAVAVAAGVRVFGLDVERVPTFLVACEDDGDELHRRLVAIAAALGIVESGLLDHCTLLSRVGYDSSLGAFDANGSFRTGEFYRQLRLALEELRPRLIVLDNAFKLFSGNANDPVQVSRFLSILERLAIDLDAAVLLVHHIAKGEGSTFSGTSAWSNAVRSRLFLDRPQGKPRDTKERVLSREKSNYAGAGVEIAMVWHHGAFVPLNALGAELGGVDSERDQAARQAFLACLDQLHKQRRAVVENGRAANYAPRVMADMRAVRGFTQQELARAMAQLLDDDQVRVNMEMPWLSDCRHKVFGLARSPTRLL